ncbi:MAG: APC family permease, partial [Firmicutes bacterium]|nr:APC family permease [Bacillota bacterium]
MQKISAAHDVTDSRLKRNALSRHALISAALANVAPAMSFFFSFGLITAGAGRGSPLTIAAAAIAMLFHANSLSEFSRALPSTGSYITFIGRSFGGIAAIITAWVTAFGYIAAMGSVIAIIGGWSAILLQKAGAIPVPWPLISLGFVLLSGFLMIRGIVLSTRWVIALFVFELASLLLAGLAILWSHPDAINFSSFMPRAVRNGLKGIGLGFPLAVYLFIGSGNSAALAEEASHPRQTIPRAIYTTVLYAAVLYLFLAWTTMIGLQNNPARVEHAAVPFIAASTSALGSWTLLVYIAGLISTFASLIGGSNSEARVIFSAARERVLPTFLAHISKKRTPDTAIIFFLSAAGAAALLWGMWAPPLHVFSYLGTLGGLPITLVYIAVNAALPVYYWREQRARFSWGRHIILPAAGSLSLLLPLWGFVQPGQAAPYRFFPFILAGYILLSGIYALWRHHRDAAA